MINLSITKEDVETIIDSLDNGILDHMSSKHSKAKEMLVSLSFLQAKVIEQGKAQGMEINDV